LGRTPVPPCRDGLAVVFRGQGRLHQRDALVVGFDQRDGFGCDELLLDRGPALGRTRLDQGSGVGERFRQYGPWLDHCVHQADGLGFCAGQRASREQQVSGVSTSNESRKQPGAGVLCDQSEPGERGSQGCLTGADADVAGDGESEPEANCRTVDRGDDRLGVLDELAELASRDLGPGSPAEHVA
jgi:hypothetical protein